MSARLKFTIAYDGASFAGWQSQKHTNTIQDRLEKAFHEIAGKHLRVHGAGRTDAGVHALAQVAHVDLPNEKFPAAARWTSALNAVLPSGIRVLRCAFVASSFHARFSAKGKVYRYRIWTAPMFSPFEINRAWHVRSPLDLETIVAVARSFIGTHDFAAFAANRGRLESNTVRTIRSARVRRAGPLISIDFDGDGFLYKMVRLMVGAIVRCASGKSNKSEIQTSLISPSISRLGFAAPAGGLFLVRVRY
ncbi:MAG: tRNA pseudouridine(38-40) synthase TruA [Verrucomicrobiota bacterium]